MEYIVYTDRHENFPRDPKRKVRVVAVAACAADIRRGFRAPLPIYAAEYNMRFHVQSAGISLLGETIHQHICTPGNHRYANYLRGTTRGWWKATINSIPRERTVRYLATKRFRLSVRIERRRGTLFYRNIPLRYLINISRLICYRFCEVEVETWRENDTCCHDSN